MFDQKAYMREYGKSHRAIPENRESARLRQRKWALTPEAKAKRIEYKKKTRAGIREAEKALYWRNHDKSLEKCRRNNKKTGTARMGRWRRKHPDRASAVVKRYKARKRGAKIAELTVVDWQTIRSRFANSCAYRAVFEICSFKPGQQLTQDHVIPLSKGGLHTKDNVVPACRSCNSWKKDKLLTGLVFNSIEQLFSKKLDETIQLVLSQKQELQ